MSETNVPPEHQTGHGTIECEYCNNTLDVECGRETLDVAYCNACEVEYKRRRERIAEPEKDGFVLVTPIEEHPKYKEYYCESCGETHANTIPTGEWRHEKVKIGGYDEVWIKCPCGRMNGGHIEVGETVECQCGREFELVVRNDPRYNGDKQ